MSAELFPRVRVVDHVVLPAAEVERWLEGWRTDYLPGALGRGMRHVATRRQYAGVAQVAVTIDWELPEPYAFYGMRGAAAADPTVAGFWADTDRRATSRERSVHAVAAEVGA